MPPERKIIHIQEPTKENLAEALATAAALLNADEVSTEKMPPELLQVLQCYVYLFGRQISTESNGPISKIAIGFVEEPKNVQ